MEPDLKYLFVFFASLGFLLVYGYFFGVSETSDEYVKGEDSQIYYEIFGELRQIEK
jgi:hypothetical protein